MTRVRKLAIAVLVAGSLVAPVQAVVTPTPLPAALTADISVSHLACAKLQVDELQLAIDHATNNAAGVAADLTLVKDDRAALKTDNQALQTAVGAYLKPARDAVSAADTVFVAAFVKLKADVIAHPGLVSVDVAAIDAAFATLTAAEAQLQANKQALAGAGATDACGHGGEDIGGPRHD